MAEPPTRAFVFYDPTGRRWARFRRTTQTFVIALFLLAALFVLALFANYKLPSMGLPQAQIATPAQVEVRSIIKGEKVERNVPFKAPRDAHAQKDMRKDARDLKYVRSVSPVMHPKQAAVGGEGKPYVFGFYVNWDRGSKVSLRINMAHLTHLLPEWFVLQNAEGDIDDQTDPEVVDIARQANLPIIAMLTNYRDGWQDKDVRRILMDAGLRKTLIDNIVSNLDEHKFQGINIDFEQITRADRDSLTVFMRELKARLGPLGLLVTEDVPVDDDAYDLKGLAQANDFLLPMVYDEHYQSGSPGPIASEAWFEDHLDKLAKTVPADKVVIGMGAYGYDWIIGGSTSEEVGFNRVMSTAITNPSTAKVEWAHDEGNPVLRYASGAEQHEVWFLDAVTALNMTQAIHDKGFRGVAVWRLGAEDPDLWQVLQREAWPDDSYNPAQLSVLTASKQVNDYSGGEFLRVLETPRDGSREVSSPKTPDADYTEVYKVFPTYFVIEDSGNTNDKVIALSFDDGPDSKYTPRVLDILSRYHVPATFFVIGVNAERNIDLIKREYREGHEIGNHTYSHPNIALVGDYRTALELSATQRIVENATGHSTTLFRPPYNADSEPQTPNEIKPIERAQHYGYITVAESIDPRDWQTPTTATAILDEVKAEEANGHIILLHDAGGNREATIEALPRIIEYFQSKGYRFIRAGDLIGKTPAEVMPKPSEEELRWAHIEGQAFDLKSNFLGVLGILFLCAIYLTVARSVVYGFLAVIQKFRSRRRVFDLAYQPPVSVVIAAFNEEKVIVRTVESILANHYEELEIIVVNDGSKDRTYELLVERFGEHPQVRVLTQPNGGKSAALNKAILHANHEVIIAVDADTVFSRNTVGYLARHFADPRIGAVSGNARVGNRNKWITRFQSIEYIYGFNLDRRALDLLNAITVVPGAVGAWRKALVLELGGFGHDTLAEDTDLTLSVRRLGYVVRYDEKAIAYTEAPEDTKGLAKQRFRWAFGTLQAAWKHRDAMFVPRYGTLGFVALPSIWLFQVLLSALSPFAEICMILALILGNGRIVAVYYVAFFGLELLTGILAYSLEGVSPLDLTLLFFQRVYYRQLMHYVLAKSLIFAMRGRLVGWGKLERRASVSHVH
jgi:cellulose synthase/poly-beta-1,6-N-acetylglucosamine synthase-like glycosyltransferase/spore germination protein YaaH/peptidoglycan/xylan/chitin deacetylase (PgdA/CDA1 family)